MKFITLSSLFFLLLVLDYQHSAIAQSDTNITQTTVDAIPWQKLWNNSFVDDYIEQEIILEVKWIGVAQTMMHQSAAIRKYKKGDWVQVGITTKDDIINPALFNQYSNQKWTVFIPKSQINKALDIESGSNIRITAVGKSAKTMSLPKYLILEISSFERL